nr:phage polarity suppression protein [Pseudescherichia sp.]
MQRLSIRPRLNDFIQAHGTELATDHAPELMNLNRQPALIKNRAFDRTTVYVYDALAALREKVRKLIIPHKIMTFEPLSDSGLSRPRGLITRKNIPPHRI